MIAAVYFVLRKLNLMQNTADSNLLDGDANKLAPHFPQNAVKPEVATKTYVIIQKFNEVIGLLIGDGKGESS